LLILFLALCSCTPQQPAEPAPAESEPPEDGIPWAPGDRPASAEATTRDFQALEEEDEPGDVAYARDGITPDRSTARCKGTEPAVLAEAIVERATSLSVCQEKIPKGQSVEGDLIWALRIDEKGDVVSLALIKDSVRLSAVTACGEQILKKNFSTAPPFGGCVEYNIPLRIQTKTEPAPAEKAEEKPSE
jgi:hypothetical protein